MEDNDIITRTKDNYSNSSIMPKLDDDSKQDYKKFKNYSNNKLNRAYEKYDVLQSYSPAKNSKDPNKEFSRMIDEYNSYEPTRETLSLQRGRKGFNQMSKKNLIYCASMIAVSIILVILIVVNSATINNLNKDLNNTTNEINNVQTRIDDTIGDINDLTLEDNIYSSAGELGMEDVGDSTQKIDLLEKQEVNDYQRQTNVFDAICNFISSLFGG